MRVLFVTSEAYPLIKTGGLADVCGSLPRALAALGDDVRLLLPAYRDAIAAARHGLRRIASVSIDGLAVDILETRLPGTRVKTWLVHCPAYFDRPGNPYQNDAGADWPDNAARFLLFCRAAAALAQDRCGLGWRADLVHCNDWQSGLVPALLSLEPARPASVFTIHNLAYQGLFSYDTFAASGLPAAFWDYRALEFHGNFSFIKGGIVYADRVNTVSPTYAAEIQGDTFGYGLQGLLQHRAGALSGILNGIDANTWNPGTDSHLAQRYNSNSVALKTHNKTALQHQLGLAAAPALPLYGFIGRLVEQKGIDLLLAAIPALLAAPAQLAVLGSGAGHFEAALRDCAARYPQSIAVHIGYDETLAHRIEAGADIFLMPSRFEPCGLNQLYSLRYGTLPVVHRVGGLADTVTDADSAAAGNGFTFDTATVPALLATLQRAAAAYREPERWRQLQRNAMRRDFSWRASALAYRDLYAEALAASRSQPGAAGAPAMPSPAP